MAVHLVWRTGLFTWIRRAAPAIAVGLGGAALLTTVLTAQKAPATGAEVRAILEKKCSQCHSQALQMGGLDLSTREAMLKGGAKGPAIAPGNAGASTLIHRVTGRVAPKMPMAPLPPLTDAEVAALTEWINAGAHWDPAASAAPQAKTAPTPAGYSNELRERAFTETETKWWAFQPPVRRTPPAMREERWAHNPIDQFIKASLDAKGLRPAPKADRSTLIRRATLDLTGLLPTPAEVQAFVSDQSPDAYRNLIERLLGSSHYGERWGRNWLDVVRYADSSGFEHDRDLATAWRFRDYVIRSFNNDKPFNRFLVEHLAGDELPGDDLDAKIATAFYRIGPRVRFREKDNPFYRYEYLDDIIRTTFQGFMGISVHCARCHDHKFDPITRADYYRSMGMFFGFVNYDHPLMPEDKVREWERKTSEVMRAALPLKQEVAKIEAPYRKALFDAGLAKLPDEVQAAIRVPAEMRTPGQKLLAAQFERPATGDGDPNFMGDDPVLAQITTAGQRAPNLIEGPRTGGAMRRGPELVKVNEADHARRAALLARIAEIEKQMPPTPHAVEGVRDGDYRLAPDGPGDEPSPGKTYRPDYPDLGKAYLPEPGSKYEVPWVRFGANGLVVEDDNKAPVVPAGYLRVLTKDRQLMLAKPLRPDYTSGGRRWALAEFIASPDNPLTSRVIVNRVWYWHFGRGIVATPGNLGKMGTAPSHPELLDWLATEFIRQGWSIKQIHRLIMNSETYQQASAHYDSESANKDPDNIHLWRFPVRRLEAEAIRDVILSASGKLNLEAGGPPFFPSIPPSVREGYRQGKWLLTKEEPATWRRGIYSYWKRGMKYPMFEVHDQPDQNVTAEKRNITTVPTQALTLLNNEFVLIQARHLAERVVRDSAGATDEDRIRALYRIALSRDPNPRELERQAAFLAAQRGFQATQSRPDPALAALTDLAHVMLNANEFVYIN
ncbi:MAG: DUF1553 domain-containing protein [Acidobacteria bacterium]|nr:DUF1553 domain-containing protein [Acidobacteriota bacterium]